MLRNVVTRFVIPAIKDLVGDAVTDAFDTGSTAFSGAFETLIAQVSLDLVAESADCGVLAANADAGFSCLAETWLQLANIMDAAALRTFWIALVPTSGQSFTVRVADEAIQKVSVHARIAEAVETGTDLALYAWTYARSPRKFSQDIAFNDLLGVSGFVVTSGANVGSRAAGETVRVKVRAQTVDRDPVPGAWVEWIVQGGGGQVVSSQATTDATGSAYADWRMGANSGPAELLARSPGRLLGASVVATVFPSVLVANSLSTSFSAIAGGTVPAVQSVVIGASSGSLSGLTRATTYGEGNGWLTATMSSASTSSASPATLSIQPNTTGLAAGSYNATIRVAESNGSYVDIAVAYAVTTPLDPIVVSAPATLIGASGFTMNGTVNPQGVAPVANYFERFDGAVCAGAAEIISLQTITVAGSAPVTRSNAWASGAPSTSYSYRLAAQRGGGQLQRGACVSAATLAGSLVKQSGDGQTGAVNAALTLPIVIRVLRGDGTPVSGVAVVWSTPSNGGSLTGTSTSTNAQGQAQSLWILGGATGTQTVSVSSSATGSPVTFSATATGANTLVAVSGNSQSGAPNGILTQPLVVEVRNAANAPVAGATVAWQVITSGGGSLTPNSSVTNAQGRAQSAWTLGSVPGNFLARATLAGGSGTGTSVDFTASSVRSLSKLSGDNQAGAPGVALTRPIVVRLMNADGTSASGVAITWGTPSNGGSLSSTSTTTNSQGQAQSTWTLGSTNGAQTVTASAAATGSPVSFSATATSSATLTLVSGSGQSGVPSAALAQPLVVEVRNAVGLVSGATIDWSMVTSGGGSLTPSSSTTGANGRAQTAWTLGAAPGNFLARATLRGASGGGSTVDFTASSVRALSKQSGDNQTGAIGAALAQPIVVRVLNADGSPASGVTIAWGTPSGGGSLSSSSPSTNAQGLAQSTWTLGGSTGAQTVSASATATGSPVTFNATGTGGNTVSVVSGSGQFGARNTALPQPLVVMVRNASGSAVGGVTIDFSVVTSGGGSVLPTSVVTNAQGRAQATWTTGSAAGTLTADAMIRGTLTKASFSASTILQLQKVSGDGQSAVGGSTLTQPLKVRFTEANGAAIAGQPVTFSVTSGGGGVSPTSIATDAQGFAQASWTLGTSGSQNARAMVNIGANGSPATFTATIGGDPYEPNNDFASAASINVGTTSASLSGPTDKDYFKPTLPGASSVTIRATPIGVTSAQFIICLVDATGNEFGCGAWASAGQEASVAYENLPINARFVVSAVSGVTGNTSYALQLSATRVASGNDSYEPDNSQATAKLIVSGIPQERALDNVNDRDWFDLGVATPSNVTFRVTLPSGPQTVCIDLYQPGDPIPWSIAGSGIVTLTVNSVAPGSKVMVMSCGSTPNRVVGSYIAQVAFSTGSEHVSNSSGGHNRQSELRVPRVLGAVPNAMQPAVHRRWPATAAGTSNGDQRSLDALRHFGHYLEHIYNER